MTEPPRSSESAFGWLRELAEPVFAFLEGVGRIVLLIVNSIYWAIRPPYRFSLLLQAMEFAGVQSIFIVALTGTFTGMVLALQLVYTFRQFSMDTMVGMAVAVALTREMSPVFAALMFTARGGSAIAAELGNMRVTEQIDALVTMGVSPVQYLVAPRVVAATLMLPLLCILFTCVGMAGCWLIAVEWLHVDPGGFIARIESGLQVADVRMGLIKSAVFGFLVAAISCNQGFNAEGGARGVGQATTRAVVQSSVAILVANYILTSWLTEL